MMKIWLVGMHGIVASTAITGAKAIERGLVDKTGLVSELEPFKDIERYVPFSFEFGGHEIRLLDGTAYDAALYHWKELHHFNGEILDGVKEDLEKIKAQKGTALNCGSGIEEFGEISTLEQDGLTLREIVERILDDLRKFKDDNTVVINVASTEPVAKYSEEYHGSLEGFERMIDENRREYVTASMLYAYAALKLGIPYGNFTPSAGSSIPALKELSLKNNVPHAGNDGKTGETLVKTTLAPMFSYRNLRILGWMSYNILGDYDGMVLNHQDNKESKVISKDSTLEKVLGYSPYTITDIKFFPSLYDNKIAFDFIHFQGFLGRKMKMHFIWDGIDAILAAPLVLDIARFLLFAKKKGIKGVVKEMAFFFKSPMETDVINTHRQYEQLISWFQQNL